MSFRDSSRKLIKQESHPHSSGIQFCASSDGAKGDQIQRKREAPELILEAPHVKGDLTSFNLMQRFFPPGTIWTNLEPCHGYPPSAPNKRLNYCGLRYQKLPLSLAGQGWTQLVVDNKISLNTLNNADLGVWRDLKPDRKTSKTSSSSRKDFIWLYTMLYQKC